MEKLDCYLGVAVSLIAFYFCIIIYLRNQGNFRDIPGIPPVTQKDNLSNSPLEEDTRYKYPNNPPVNPIVKKSIIQTVVPANDTFGTPLEETNTLLYSGGLGELIKIPLQMNVPEKEMLRSYNVLITPYNKVKYSNSC